MKVSLSWLKEFVNFKLSPQELADQLSLRSIGVKQVTKDYIELDLTYNRGDLLSVRGVAKEVAAITNSKTTSVDQPFSKYNLPKTPVKVENSKLCSVYCIAKIGNLKVEHSNETWVKKLSDSGIRSVNNIADVTNLIMLEYGQPMHAFDADKARGGVRVRVAKENEKIKTLDGKERTLSEEDLVIADEEKAIGIAGVMGGKNTEISSSSSTLLLEAAIFDPVAIRRTSKRHGLYSEASKRFQHGLTKNNLLQALAAAIKMYESLGGKLTALTLVGDLTDKPKVIQLSAHQINSLLGVEIPEKQVESSLKSLGFNLSSHMSSGNLNWEVTAPYWRLDINIEEDLIEEIARMYGYEKIGDTALNNETMPRLDQSLPNFIYDLKLKLKELGLTEIQSYSFCSSAVLEALQLTEEGKSNLLRVANPISSETEFMRMDLWPNLVEMVGKNIKQGLKDIGIFEVGKLYFRNKDRQPEEKYRLAIALMNGSDNPLKELVALVKDLALSANWRINLNLTNPPKESAGKFHPKRFVNIEKDGKTIGGMAEVHLRLLNKLDIENRVTVIELNLHSLI